MEITDVTKRPIAFIFPNRWQDGAESLGIERPQKVAMVHPIVNNISSIIKNRQVKFI